MTENGTGPVRKSGPTLSSAYLLKPDDQWTKYDLRDYIVKQIQERDPALLAVRKNVIELSTCQGFISRHGAALAVAITKFAFERLDGTVNGRAVDFRRFTRNADLYFAQPIIAMLPKNTATPPQDAA